MFEQTRRQRLGFLEQQPSPRNVALDETGIGRWRCGRPLSPDAFPDRFRRLECAIGGAVEILRFGISKARRCGRATTHGSCCAFSLLRMASMRGFQGSRLDPSSSQHDDVQQLELDADADVVG